VIPLARDEAEAAAVMPVAEKVREALGGVFDPLRIKLDTRTDLRPAERFFDWVQQGVPLRIEIGPRDVKEGQAMLVRRDTREKAKTPLERAAAQAQAMLDTMQKDLFNRARAFREENTHVVDDYGKFKEIMAAKEGGFIMAHWNGSGEVEQKIKEETKATIRCIPLNGAAGEKTEAGKCILTGEPSKQRVVFAQAY